MFELIVEITYPIEQAASFSLVLLSNAIQGTILRSLEGILSQPLSEAEFEIQTCSDKEDHDHEEGRDYLPYTIFISAYAAFSIILYIFFFHPEMKRAKVEKSVHQNNKIAPGIVPTVAIEGGTFGCK